VREAAPSLKPASNKPRLTSRSEPRIALAQRAARPAPPSTGVVRRDNSTVVHHDKSVVGRTIGVTDDIVAATQRAILAVAVIPSWIGSIGREGQSSRHPATLAAERELRPCTRVSMTRRGSASKSSSAYCDRINHMHAWNERHGNGGHGRREGHDDGRDG
jgi:hypothetical protein